MLLIDGVRYTEWTINSENKLTEDDLEQMAIEHSDEIFGEGSIYLDKKHKLKTITGVGSIPDGFAIVFSNQPEWRIVEVELSSHDIYEHVVQQVTKFMDGIENLNSKDNLFEAIWNAIDSNYLLKHRLEKASGASNPHWFLSNIIKKSRPIITLIIEKEQQGLEGTLSKFTYLQHKIVEFRTFRRVSAETVHAHLFEPLYRLVAPKIESGITPDLIPQIFEHILTNPDLEYERFRISKKEKGFFPPPKKGFDLIIDNIPIRTNTAGAGAIRIRKNLKPWFRKHRNVLKAGDKVNFIAIEPMNKYRLEIV
jgi:hypothetical protein